MFETHSNQEDPHTKQRNPLMFSLTVNASPEQNYGSYNELSQKANAGLAMNSSVMSMDGDGSRLRWTRFSIEDVISKNANISVRLF
jgi:hypothetical protein